MSIAANNCVFLVTRDAHGKQCWHRSFCLVHPHFVPAHFAKKKELGAFPGFICGLRVSQQRTGTTNKLFVIATMSHQSLANAVELLCQESVQSPLSEGKTRMLFGLFFSCLQTKNFLTPSCMLCWKKCPPKQLAGSHIIPNSILKRLSSTFVDDENEVIGPGKATLRMLCRERVDNCETLFNQCGEDYFVRSILDGSTEHLRSFLQGFLSEPRHAGMKEKTFAYSEKLFYLVVSVAYRVILSDGAAEFDAVWPNMKQHHRQTLYIGLSQMRAYLLSGVVNNITIHLLVDPIPLATQLMDADDVSCMPVNIFQVIHRTESGEETRAVVFMFSVGGLCFLMITTVCGTPWTEMEFGEYYFPKRGCFCRPINPSGGNIVVGDDKFWLSMGCMELKSKSIESKSLNVMSRTPKAKLPEQKDVANVYTADATTMSELRANANAWGKKVGTINSGMFPAKMSMVSKVPAGIRITGNKWDEFSLTIRRRDEMRCIQEYLRPAEKKLLWHCEYYKGNSPYKFLVFNCLCAGESEVDVLFVAVEYTTEPSFRLIKHRSVELLTLSPNLQFIFDDVNFASTMQSILGL